MKRHTYEQEFLGGLISLAGGAISSLFGGGGGSGGGGGLGGVLQQNDVGGQLISSGIGQINSAMDAKRDWKYYKKQSALDYEYATKMADYNAQIARDQYDYEYEKESPAARRQQFEDAGLNSALMYGAGGQGMQGAVSSPQGSIPHGSMPHRKSSMEGLVAAAQMRQANTQQSIGESTADRNEAAAELDRERANTEKRDQLLKDLEAISKQIENERDSEMLEILKEQKEEIIRSIGVENKRKEAEARSLDAATQWTIERAIHEVEKRKLTEKQIETEGARAKELLSRTFANYNAGNLSKKLMDEVDAKVASLAQQVKVDKARIWQMVVDMANTNADTFKKRYDLELRRMGINTTNPNWFDRTHIFLANFFDNGFLDRKAGGNGRPGAGFESPILNPRLGGKPVVDIFPG